MSTTDVRGAAAGDLAAQALLGALLWEPGRIRDVSDWLESADFEHWAHRAIYQTLTGLIADGRPVVLQDLPGILARGEYHDAHVDSTGSGPLSAPALHTLLSMTPATPDRAHRDQGGTARSEHVRYARIVLDNSVRRQVAAVGARIEQLGRTAAQHDDQHSADPMGPALAEVRAALQRLEGRVATSHAGRVSITEALSGAPPVAELPQRGEPRTSVTAPAALKTAAVPSSAEAERAERAFIGACLVAPEVRSAATEWLRPEDFASPDAAQTWRVVLDMTQRGDPVDFVLVAVEVETARAVAHAAGLELVGYDPSTLHRLAERGDQLGGHRAAEVIRRAALQRITHRARTELDAVAENRAFGSRALLQNAQQTVSEAQQTSGRLSGQSAPSIAAAMFTGSSGLAAVPPPRMSSSEHAPPRSQQARGGSPRRRR
ncbi:DnaB domain protein helicase domain protein (plasmid) [Pseudonocardia dioxanivorans CB1190]|uniref:DnaB domain protein helicase domain protein n=1 Tax=Pseudonocardia dioxanivorans (strain ATCC 55486 / DSM 44775 / JCM 13855 / CB1190) TaxID=675635 RepID=F2L6Y9_PSEUX|nr:DnaB-like helicase N-terminal domain-containing protein [Pseudonocardia dioxanivorans]AEA28962.1 DnaB domain protein helicase domain protein [Pseudonocardia dioxanivorans CB1190]